MEYGIDIFSSMKNNHYQHQHHQLLINTQNEHKFQKGQEFVC